MTHPKRILGIDIGGANLKLADDRGHTRSRSFALWRHPDQLADQLCEAISFFENPTSIAVVMTGELTDCFVDRIEGVAHIVAHVRTAAKKCKIPSTHFYGVDGRFRESVCIDKEADLLAAANWHALANFVGREICSTGLLVDIGSTTTDIIPILSGRVATQAKTDYDRLTEGSLIYVGCQRTPVCAIVDCFEFRGKRCPVMNEVFATIDDARIVLKNEPEHPQDNESADGKPRSRSFATNRLARMIGLDRRTVSSGEAVPLAKQVMQNAIDRIDSSITKVLELHGLSTDTFVISGHGSDLLKPCKDKLRILLADQLGSSISRCAPSYAVARLLKGKQQPTI
ncbi:hypothetical protein CA13_51850 [Planctomycetes bacterium CA13]|uniref:Hydantoinase A/oxoprolinase domain-containing protein n=1 Tax=Novipirellula herctigrandis TaxID=2527986 RepID=A0A5C5Z917_9BACT|nr:hypothetical protein CA13_51850 [Planctomycetes bacterium CA13]